QRYTRKRSVMPQGPRRNAEAGVGNVGNIEKSHLALVALSQYVSVQAKSEGSRTSRPMVRAAPGETSGRVGIEAFRNCRPERQQHNNHNRAACNHMIRSPADHQGHYSQNTKRRATRFLTKG